MRIPPTMLATHSELRFQGGYPTNKLPHYSPYESSWVEPLAHAPVTYPTPIPTARSPVPRSSNDQTEAEDYLPLGATLAPRVSQQASNKSAPQRKNEEAILLDDGRLSDLSQENSPARPSEPRDDPFQPFPVAEGIIEQRNPLTVRAVFLGLLFGSLVNAAELYSGETVFSCSTQSVDRTS